MLITKNYLSMCEKAFDRVKTIVESEGFRGKDFDKMSAQRIYIINDESQGGLEFKFLIPTQQQIQHIISFFKEVRGIKLAEKMSRFIFNHTNSGNNNQDRIMYLSFTMEEWWMSLLMDEVFGRQWSGGLWGEKRIR